MPVKTTKPTEFYYFESESRNATKWAALWQNQQNEYVPSEDSDQPGHLPSLIRIFAVRSMGS